MADLTGNYDSEGYVNFSVAKLGVCYKSKKVNLTTSESTGISRVTDKYRGNGTGSLRRKFYSYNSTMSRGLLSTQIFSVNWLILTKLIDLLLSKVHAILPWKIRFWFFQQEQILSLKKQGSYQGMLFLGT